MPALLEVTLGTTAPRPRGLLGVPLHGLVFAALEHLNPGLSAHLHAAEVKPFRVGAAQWQDVEGGAVVRFLLGALADDLTDVLLEAFTPGGTHGDENATLWGEVLDVEVLARETYAALYARHAGGTSGRTIHLRFVTPTTFQATGLDMPFPVPKTVFYGLQRRWEAFSDLRFGEDLNGWVGRAVRVQDFQLRPRSVYFKGVREAALSACVGEVQFTLARPGDIEPAFVRLLADYANFAGVGYKTTYGLGHVEAWGWREHARE
ncbi:CRISPR system precrRNA processing endoribonuclease RAMP protein Cas6 [Deinococcus sp. SDU3-2]|uniref:CRISPR system precrRNA processing endoribonuclease RAMP protein Cas6 n=1 Tax=Deinococcus terrestris TaxID=2651870 RepID=A0A7X1TRI6_9DEIO|nr:CRISPR system precrRNA processing endoribonuclease RAMP protein Cas6 [Deinococcus terrestris]MPY66372.1 CRISPR system precrRNA processing endoribonuclease RAMP protein Cas6 [Deinococcus terrestris]